MKSYAFTRTAARIVASAVVVAAMVPGPARAQDAASQRTHINTTSAGYLGILGLRCDCTLSADPDVSKRIFIFRSEPVVTDIEAGSPAAGLLSRGDIITHIDGLSLRSSEGARRFASIRPGQKVNLTIRNDGRTLRVALTAAALDWSDRRVLGNVAPSAGSGYAITWDAPGLPPAVAVAPRTPSPPEARAAAAARTPPPGVSARAVAPEAPGATPRAPAVAQGSWAVVAPDAPYPPGVATGGAWTVEVPWFSAMPRGWFGFSVRCSSCGWASSDRRGDSPVFESKTAPELGRIESGSPAAKAGLRSGDILTHIDGVSIVTPRGGRKFGGVAPGQKVRVTVLRNGRSMTRELTLGSRPEARAASAVVAGRQPRAAVAPLPPRRELRYTGRLDDVTVEVFSAAGPTIDRTDGMIVITVGGTVVRLKVDPSKDDR